MLTDEERKFMVQWEYNRHRKKKLIRQLAVGLPLSVGIVVAIVVNLFSGWYKRADMEIRSNSSIIVTVLIAVILIVIFTTVFSQRHKWDINEQRYRELKAREDKN